MKQIDTKELANLLKDSYKLECLDMGGVDNWEGYDYSLNYSEDDYLSYWDYSKQSDEELTQNYKSSNALELFTKLPYLTEDEQDNLIIASEENTCPYIPTLYYYDEMFVVDWCSGETGDTIYAKSGNTPEEAIQKAYDWCLTNKFIKND